MARSRKRRSPSAVSRWPSLTWDDLESWAGSRSVARGRTYQRKGRVQDLAISKDGRLLATVQGQEVYVTSVWLQTASKAKGDGPVQSRCTCPVGYDGCKHAVAVVAEYLQMLADENEVGSAPPDDARWARLTDDDDDDDRYDDYDDADDDATNIPRDRSSTGPPGAPPTGREWGRKIRDHIEAKDRDELVDLLESLIRRFPELHEEFKERIMLGEGDADRLVAEARRELRELTARPGWSNHWNDEGYTPDYSRLQHRLERLTELGHHDAVATLGKEIIELGTEQVEQSHDEGETAMALATCLPIVFDAVAQSSLSGSQKLLFAIDARLQDDYDVIGDAADAVLGVDHAPADWSQVADELAGRLPATAEPGGDDFHSDYARDSITSWLADALDKADRSGEVLALYEREARITSSYQRLVRFLIDRKSYDDAQQWALQGIEKTREKLPGIAAGLAALMGELARRRRQWPVVAAHAAREFFAQPGRSTFQELVKAAGKARCRTKVRQAALRFLETGVAPVRIKVTPKRGRRVAVDPDWPLPVPDCLAPLMRSDGATPARPHYDVLLDMAIADKRVDDVLHWYDRLGAKPPHASLGWRGGGDFYADRVAEVVARSHPQRALDIYRRHLDANLTNAHIAAYETCASYLRKMKPIMKSLGCADEWTQLLEDIRLKYRNRPRFMEILERLNGRTILQSQRTRHKRR